MEWLREPEIDDRRLIGAAVAATRLTLRAERVPGLLLMSSALAAGNRIALASNTLA
jgi:hypothetical protein